MAKKCYNIASLIKKGDFFMVKIQGKRYRLKRSIKRNFKIAIVTLALIIQQGGSLHINHDHRYNEVQGLVKPQYSDVIDLPELENKIARKSLSDMQYETNVTVREKLCQQLADSFAGAYGIDAEAGAKILLDNVDNICRSDNASKDIRELFEQNIANGNLPVQKANNIFSSGERNLSRVKEFKKSERGQIAVEVANEYGIDPNYFLAKMCQESGLDHTNHLPGGSSYNGSAYGICQVEHTRFGSEYKAYNFNKNVWEDIKISNSSSNRDGNKVTLNVNNFRDNLKIGASTLQTKLHKYDYNLGCATQAYNYGGAFDLCLEKCANKKGISVDSLVSNVNDTSYLSYVKDLHSNPSKYISNWSYSTYGDDDYISHVLGYLDVSDGSILTFKDPRKNETVFINAYNLKASKINSSKLDEQIDKLQSLNIKINVYEDQKEKVEKEKTDLFNKVKKYNK